MASFQDRKGDPDEEVGRLADEEREARRIVRRAAISAALAGALPVPLGSFAGVPAVQAKMLVELAGVFGRPLQLRAAADLAAFLGGTSALRYMVRLLSRTAAKSLPAIGPAAGAASAFGSTFALGLVAIRYLRSDSAAKGAGRDLSDPSRFPDVEGFEREARALRLEWESGAISERTYRQDLEALRNKFLSSRGDPPDDP
ncbi:MAG: DUF697 domain-containing protein [Nitrospinota bacterium]